jgi:pyruvate-formate lyase-activating enzyme
MKKVLLLLLPYWAPVVPPSGLSCLKGYLKQHGFNVKTVDANVELELREMYDTYFHHLKQYVPEDKQSFFFNIGNEVWQNHMMAYMNYTDEAQYIELVKLLVYNTFFCPIDDNQAAQLNRIIAETYARLEVYLTRLLEHVNPSILGISVYIGTAAASLFAFRLVRRRYPHIRTVMGGGIFNGLLSQHSPNLAYFLEKTKDCIDHVIIGEGEMLFLKLLRGEFSDSKRVIMLKDIGGELLELSGANVPDMSDFNLDYYPYLTAYASRSCPFQCSFCSDPVFWGKYRKKKARQVAEELIENYHTYGSQLYIMSDLLLNPIASDLAGELIDAGISVYWDTHFRVGREVCDPKNTLLWRKGGLYRVQLGTESGSQRVLDLMGKKITVDQIKTAVSTLANTGIKTTTYWVIGHPGETEEDFQQTLDLIEELKNDIYQCETNPFWYVPNGQVADHQWHSRSKTLFPEWARELLIIQQWVVDEPPDREERYKRMNRFAQHCRKLGIPNPYSTHEIHLADLRWKKLHKNAVPALEDFKEKGVYIDENKNVKELNIIRNIVQHDDNWGF